MEVNKKRIVFISSLVISIAGYNFWKYAWHDFFYQCMATFILGLAYLLKEEYKGKDKVLEATGNIFFWLAVGNLCDELFFDPTSYNWGEYAFALYVLYTFIPIRKTK